MKNNTLTKIINWEYWPSTLFYIPNLPYAFYLALKARSLTFYSIANPAIKSSGNGTESKFKTIDLLPTKYKPKSVLVLPNTDFNKVITTIKQAKIQFPLIAKPDIGFRGLLVKKINTKQELQTYLLKYPITIIVQEFLDYENECGVFYYRNPKNKKGRVSSLTLKRFLSITGDGVSTLKELILKDNRAKLYIDIFSEIHKEKLGQIPKKNKKIKLTAIGNHSKGTEFINGNHLISKQLIETFDKLSMSVDGWYYGRVDVKYNTFENLENGTDFKVLEINGIIAEPTHIYDSENSTYFRALKSIRTHWKALYEIAIVNHQLHKTPYKSTKIFIKEMIELRKYTKSIERLNRF